MAEAEIYETPKSIQIKRNTKHPLIKKFIKGKYFFLMFLPCLLYFILFDYVPMFGIVIAFKNYNIVQGVWDSDWVGLKYFNLFYESSYFWKLLRNTFVLSLYGLLWGFWPGLLFALLLNELRSTVFKRLVQSVSYLPHFISIVIIAGMIVNFLSPHGGIVNQILGVFGFEPIAFMNFPEYYRTIFISSGIWQGLGWGSIIYLAVLTSIDPTLYEAAEIDGASRIRKTWHVTLPGIAPAIVILLILDMGHLISVGFEKSYLLKNALNASVSEVLSTYTYSVGLVGGQYSYATTIGLFTAIINLGFLIATNYISRRFSDNSLW